MANSADNRPVRVGMVSLGCAKNLVDAEVMLGSLAQAGMEITAEIPLADVLIVNTCSFIDSAKEESIDTILQHAQVRDARQLGQALVVAGCLPQRFARELPALMPEVDAFMGLDQVTQAPQIVRLALDRNRRKPASKIKPGAARPRPSAAAAKASEPLVVTSAKSVFVPDFATPRFRLTPRHTAYVKIAEGCNHPCSFCIIPRIRGSHRSRALADVVAECRALVASGVKELNLISQDTTFYGLDLRADRSQAAASPAQFSRAVHRLPPTGATLGALIHELNRIPGDFWIRILYTHPAHWTDELIDTIAQSPKVARYVDIPLQHIHPVMLERMRRETTQQYLVDLLARLRARIPGIALRTTFIVGFPGETDAHFQELLAFIRATKFERLGVFVYSPEDGTRAAKMSAQIPDQVKQQRRDLAMKVQAEIAREHNTRLVGQVLKVLTETEAGPESSATAEVRSWEHGFVRQSSSEVALPARYWIQARSQSDAPDIDGRVYFRRKIPLGEFVQARVVDHTNYDLLAEVV
jgi:ribosomal protein S12 methylthiotransferase